METQDDITKETVEKTVENNTEIKEKNTYMTTAKIRMITRAYKEIKFWRVWDRKLEE